MPPRSVLLALPFLVAGLSPGNALSDATIPLPRIETVVAFEGESLPVALWGTAEVRTGENAPTASFTVLADLQAMQARVPAAVRGRLAHNDDCDKVVQPHTVSLTPNGIAARLHVAVHYEQWACPWTEVLGQRISLGKSKAFEQNGDIWLDLVPLVEGSTVALRIENVDVRADGALGLLMNAEAFREAIRSQVRKAFPEVLGAANLAKLLPDHLSALTPNLRAAEFVDLGAGKLGLRVSASLVIGEAQVAAILATYSR